MGCLHVDMGCDSISLTTVRGIATCGWEYGFAAGDGKSGSEMTIAEQEKLHWDRESAQQLASQIKGLIATLKMDHTNEATLRYDDHFDLIVRRKQRAPREKRQRLRREEYQRADRGEQEEDEEAAAQADRCHCTRCLRQESQAEGKP